MPTLSRITTHPNAQETLMKRLLALGAALAALGALAVIVVGGGSTSGTGSGGSAYGAAPAPKTAIGTVGVRHTKLGRILVNAQGRTLYLFEKDKGGTSACYSACASIWPPLTTGAKANAETGVTAAKLGATKRGDGKTAITYAGHPLYTYAGDQKPGDVRGQGLDQFGAEWYVLAPSGHKIDNH
jgi:predicted lipoprotein with Yx(FWY)xxD motif